MAIDSVNPPENRESASVDASERFPVGKEPPLTTDRGGLPTEGYTAGEHTRGKFPIGKTAPFTANKGGPSKWEAIAEETKPSSRALEATRSTGEEARVKVSRTLAALDLANRSTSEEIREKLTHSIDALDLAISKVQEAKKTQTSFTADPLVRKTNTETIKVCKQANSILQETRNTIHKTAPAYEPSTPKQAAQPSPRANPTLTR